MQRVLDEVDADFNIYTSYYSNFFLLRTKVLVNGENANISSVKEGDYQEPVLSFARGTIQLKHFSGVGVTGTKETPQLYCTHLYYTIKKIYDWRFCLAITQDLPVFNTVSLLICMVKGNKGFRNSKALGYSVSNTKPRLLPT